MMTDNEIPNPEIESKDEVALDPERQAQARAYAHIQRRWMLAELILTTILIVLLWVTGLSRTLKSTWEALGVTHPWALTAVYLLSLEVAGTVLFLPLAWWTGFKLPHRYNLSTQTPIGWLSDHGKVLGLEIVLGIPVAEVIYWLLRTQPETWWIWGTILVMVLGVMMGALAPVLIVPIFFNLKPLDDESLVRRIKKLAERTSTRIADVYTIDLSARTTAANAMVMGLGKTKRIALGDTLYAEYSGEEIGAILAHELGHQVHHDLELGILVQSVTTVAAFYAAHLTLRWGVVRFGFDGIADLAALPLVVLVGMLFSLVTLPLINGYSRWRERMADRYALETIDDPSAFATAITRLSNQNLAEATPPGWVVVLLYDHPPIGERLRMAEAST